MSATLSKPRGKPQCDWVNHIPNDGLIRYRTLLNSDRLLVTSPEALAEVLTTKCYDFRKPKWLVGELKHVLGSGLLLAEGNDHHFQRKILAPAFSFRHIKNLYGVFWDKLHELVNAMTVHLSCKEKEQQITRLACDKLHPSTDVLDIADWANRATLDMIGIAASCFLAILRFQLPDWLVNRLPFRRNKEIQRAVRTIRGVCAELIHQKSKSISDNSNPEHRDILSVTLQNGGFSEEGHLAGCLSGTIRISIGG
ncbi:cytochrome P450 [Aspergillus tubingensis]|uniref:Cytochrome P450 n=1 Tax=Aspergillus niger TaxID=5061 RepID=A0A100I3C7_ASPNG|nr:cytochrome P450 [Aspergillus tubingensis]GAQ33932.1 hypothetical protein AKAW_01714 [Aspergillus niger]GFN15729.1 cytochrome P450 [Aspergillus tubingensis]GLA94867.1 hypothetical protein AtubIFM57143_001860 [Aspergillus tubingensis]GLB15289.1 hypothetical protein AtubIFM61612_005104 [Aspergillus tubingensis]